jgi:hypothetical protein
MNEVQRQAYLRAMEVDSYFPRLKLPGALASTLCQLPDISEASVVDASLLADVETVPAEVINAEPVNKAGGSRVAALQALLGDKPSAPVKKKIVAQPESIEGAVADTEQQTQSTPHFSLSIIRGQNLLIIDEGLQGHVNPSEYLQLLHNILVAIGAGKQQLSIDAFVWPMVKNSPLDQSEVAARETLVSFLSKQCLQLGAKYIVLMGDTAARYISEELAVGELVAFSSIPVQLIHTISAGSVLADSALKPQLWMQLQALRLALQ